MAYRHICARTSHICTRTGPAGSLMGVRALLCSCGSMIGVYAALTLITSGPDGEAELWVVPAGRPHSSVQGARWLESAHAAVCCVACCAMCVAHRTWYQPLMAKSAISLRVPPAALSHSCLAYRASVHRQFSRRRIAASTREAFIQGSTVISCCALPLTRHSGTARALRHRRRRRVWHRRGSFRGCWSTARVLPPAPSPFRSGRA